MVALPHAPNTQSLLRKADVKNSEHRKTNNLFPTIRQNSSSFVKHHHTTGHRWGQEVELSVLATRGYAIPGLIFVVNT